MFLISNWIAEGRRPLPCSLPSSPIRITLLAVHLVAVWTALQPDLWALVCRMWGLSWLAFCSPASCTVGTGKSGCVCSNVGYICVTLQFCSLPAAFTSLNAGQCFTFPSQQLSDHDSTIAVRSEVTESDQVLRGGWLWMWYPPNIMSRTFCRLANLSLKTILNGGLPQESQRGS